MKRALIAVLVLGAVAGIAYLATVGCCHLIGKKQRVGSLTAGMSLTGDQRRAIAPLEKHLLARKEAGCAALCAKRAQLIELLERPDPDRAAVARLAEEIGREQTELEKATLEYLLAVNRELQPAQRGKLLASVREELRTACKATSCSKAGRCFVAGEADFTNAGVNHELSAPR